LLSAYVSIRQHMSAYVSIRGNLRSDCPLVAFGIVCLGSSKVLPTAYVREKKTTRIDA
jgi:hypothetical protein